MTVTVFEAGEDEIVGMVEYGCVLYVATRTKVVAVQISPAGSAAMSDLRAALRRAVADHPPPDALDALVDGEFKGP